MVKKILSPLNIQWQNLRIIQKSKFISSMYIWIIIVPIATKVLSRMERYLDFNVFGQEINFTVSLPFSWKAFFVCALVFSIANTIILLCCPRIIKDHLSLSGFSGDGKHEVHLDDYARDINLPYKYYSETKKPNETDVSFTAPLETVEREMKVHIRTNFWDLYNHASKTRMFARISSIILYSIGTILFLRVLVSNVIWVSGYIF